MEREEGNFETPAEAPIVFSPGAGYNGSRSTFDPHENAGSSTDASTLGSMGAADRQFRFTLPANSFEVDDRFVLGTPGVGATYIEAGDRQWAASSGTVTVLEVHPNEVVVALSDARFLSISANAQGNFVADGAGAFRYGKDEGPGVAEFSRDGDVATNAQLVPFGAAARTFMARWDRTSLEISDLTSPSLGRGMRLYLPTEVATGDSGTFGPYDGFGDVGPYLQYDESDPEGQKRWIAVSGNWRVLSRSRSNLNVRLENVKMAPGPWAEGNDASGAFRLNGTLRR